MLPSNVLARWQRQPRYYIDQALGTVLDALLPPGVDTARVGEVVRPLTAAPAILRHGTANLEGTAVGEFADLAIDELTGIEDRCDQLAAALGTVTPGVAPAVETACAAASSALVAFREMLIAARPGMVDWSPVGGRRSAGSSTSGSCGSWPCCPTASTNCG